jgi:hypothetical protein
MTIFKWDDEPGGLCPVQAEGTFLGHHFYFRSRYETASIEFSKTREDWEEDRLVRRYRLKTYPAWAAGWISTTEAKILIYKGLFLFFIGWPDNDK